jgi:ectoine hydroxylase-related dioxygenase (phytanoyl-CoA dioxygenase family)
MDSYEITDRFEQDGYVLVEDVLDPVTDLGPVMADYAGRLDELAQEWHARGVISSTYADLPFTRRFERVAAEAGPAGVEWIQYFDFSLPLGNVKADTPIHLSEPLFRLFTNPKLLDMVEMFVGPEILLNPIHHVRLKPRETLVPEKLRGGLTARTGWHQDQGVTLPEADETEILTVWFPVTEATVENGCLCVIPGSHRVGLVTHCPATGPAGQLRIPEPLLMARTPLPMTMRPGSVLFLHKLTEHSSLSNNSDSIRWSFDLRYQPVGKPTGRPVFPDFIVRSRSQPEREVRDWRVWADAWYEARAALSQARQPVFNRWTAEAPVCA